MAPKIRVWPVTQAHVVDLAWRMRPADIAEVRASAGFSPLEAVEKSVACSSHCGALVVDGELLAIFGAGPTNGTDVEKHHRAFLQATRGIIAELLKDFAHLRNAIDARNTRALRWARWAGFTIEAAVPYGVEGVPFHPISIRRAGHV